MIDPYFDREQTKAKHFILKHYLQELAFKILRFSDLAYIDGFSGPWESQTEDFADSSFKIAIEVLREAQRIVEQQTGRRHKIKCFFSEKNPRAFSQLASSISPFNNPSTGFEIETYCGEFESAVPIIQKFIGRSFPLVFIDPTGWSGYSFEVIRPLFNAPKCEVLINFMYDFVNRAASMGDPKIIASLNPILGGPGWEQRLDTHLPKGLAVEKLFRQTLTAAGGFQSVISTKVDRSTADRPHFFIVYGTKSPDGLKAFREVEYKALKQHARDRADARERKREIKLGTGDLFSDFHADIQEATIDDLVEEQKTAALLETCQLLRERGSLRFVELWTTLLQAHMLRVNNVRDICVALYKNGQIKNTWGGGNRKPQDSDLIELSITSKS